jgi:hypothetical protein
MKYLGKIYGGFSGLKTGKLYSIEKDKMFEAESGDVPAEYGDPVIEKKSIEIQGDVIETGSLEVKKRGRPAK